MKSLIYKIRELTNKTILKSLLLKNNKQWNLMCGSLDAIESAQMAIDSYNGLNKENITDIGQQRLVIYGLFQALYVQQDATLNLCKSINIPLCKDEKELQKKYPELYEIRELRNKGIGHPSNLKGENSSHSIMIDKDSIELFSYTETGRQFSYPKYKISDCIEKQSQSLCGIIQEVIKKMESVEKEHKDKYKQNKFRDCFPTDTQYCICKVFEAISLIDVQNQGETTPQKIGRERSISLASSHINDLIKSIDKLNKEFTERGLQDVSVRLEMEHSKYPLEKLKKYFEDVSKSSLNSQDAWAYADSANVHILDLIKSAKNFDEEYTKTT